MSIGIDPVFKPGTNSNPFKSDGVFILDQLENLRNLATENGLKPIEEFGDNRPVPDDFDGDPDELQELLGPWDEWFPVSQGLQTLDGLVRILEIELIVSEHDEFLLQELKDLAECLRSASPEGAEFRFEAG
jgi:hypothetical protein